MKKFPPLPILTTSALREIEARFANHPLMERAGLAASALAMKLLRHHQHKSCVLLCGPGNNGGDGFVTARLLKKHGVAVTVVAPSVKSYTGNAKAALLAWKKDGGNIFETLPTFERPPTLIIDALFGIGISRPARPPYSELITWANLQRASNHREILSLDIPSGLQADTGQVFFPAIRATHTISFIAYHTGTFTGEGIDYSGKLYGDTLDLPHDTLMKVSRSASNKSSIVAISADSLPTICPDVLRRATQNVHKGTFGNLAIVGGAQGMVGAPLLAARAARAVGAGKITIGFAGDHPLFDSQSPELMLRSAASLLDHSFDAYVIGCGLGLDNTAQKIFSDYLSIEAPIVLDADALSILAQRKTLIAQLKKRNAPTLLTPHPAEAAKLLDSHTVTVQEDRITAALKIAQRYHAYVVLKGSGSIVASPEGSIAINTTGNNALAFGGSGDLLAGMIGSLLAQKVDPQIALLFAVGLHGHAADLYIKKHPACGMTSHAFLRYLTKALYQVIRKSPRS